MGRGFSKSRALTGRVTNKLKRGVRELSLSKTLPNDAVKTRDIRTRSATDRTAAAATAATQPRTASVATTSVAQNETEDGGRAVHRSIVAQVRARSALMRQRVQSAIPGATKRSKLQAAADAGADADADNSNDEDGDEDDDSDLASEPDEERVSRPEVLVKYKASGRVTDEALRRVVAGVAPGASVWQLCNLGDEALESLTHSTFSKAKDAETGEPIKRGISFPTNVSVNNVLCHCRPLDESQDVRLNIGDVVKVHLGAHIDGYATSACQTVVVTARAGVQVDADNASFADREAVVSEAAANAVAAAHYGLTALARGMRIGAHGSDLTDLLRSVGSNFGVEACEGVLSNRTKRWILDGSQCIIGRRVTREDPQQDVADTEVEPFQVWTLDVAYTTSPSYRLIPEVPSIYRRNELPAPPQLRIRAAEQTLSEIRTRFLCFPFSPTMCENGVNHGRLGVSQLVRAGVIDAVPPLRGKHGVTTARASCTIAITDKRIHILAGAPVFDRVAAAVAKPLPAALSEFVTKPLTFAKGDVDADADASAVAAAADGDVPLGDEAAIAPAKRTVESRASRVPRAAHTSAQLQALMPPAVKKKLAAAAAATVASGFIATRDRSAEGGRRPMKEHRVEQE